MPISRSFRWFRAKKTFEMFDSVDLNQDAHYFTGSQEIDVSDYRRFLVLYDISEHGAIANNDRVRIIVQFRDAGGTWTDFTEWGWGSLYEEESTTPCQKSYGGECVGEEMRVRVYTDYSGSGTPATVYFVISLKATVTT